MRRRKTAAKWARGQAGLVGACAVARFYCDLRSGTETRRRAASGIEKKPVAPRGCPRQVGASAGRKRALVTGRGRHPPSFPFLPVLSGRNR